MISIKNPFLQSRPVSEAGLTIWLLIFNSRQSGFFTIGVKPVDSPSTCGIFLFLKFKKAFPMDRPESMLQTPAPGTHHVMFRGDIIEFFLTLPAPEKGTAWIRTNIGHGDIARAEILAAVRENVPPLGKDWFDIAMQPVDARTFTARLALGEVGHFEAKCYFLKDGETTPTWPEGPNTVFNVEPAHTCCGNIIYNAFVRQFGPSKAAAAGSPAHADWIKALDRDGYTVIPKSGTFRDLIKELDFIVGTLGCRILQLLPVHPAPTTYGRMGRFGSPYAALSFTAVDPALAEFDQHATPLEQFIELVDAVHRRHARIFLDIAINHTGWAASFQLLAKDVRRAEKSSHKSLTHRFANGQSPHCQPFRR